MTSCIGGVLSVDCGSKGYYQGKLSAIDAKTKNITLDCVFRDGVPLHKSIVLNGTEIVNIKVLRTSKDPSVSDEPNELAEEKNKRSLPKRKNRNQGTKSASELPYTKSKYSTNSLCQENDSSSFSSENDIPNNRRTRSRNSRKKVSGGTISDADQIRPPDFTPTPLYKKYEPQVPKPQCLTTASGNSRKKGRERGASPSGIPVVDFHNGYGHHYKKKSDLDRPIDLQTLEDDFDFDANLKLFDEEGNESDERDFFENVEMTKVSRNFAHYENILSDPNRITSWTGITSEKGYVEPQSDRSDTPCFKVVNLESVSTGGFIPCLEAGEKKRFIKECISYLGPTVYNTIVADRLFVYAASIVKRFSINIHDVVFLADKKISGKLLLQCSRGFVNRGNSVHVFGKSQIGGGIYNHCTDASDLPNKVKLIIVLSEDLPASVVEWISTQKTAHVIGFETNKFSCERDNYHVFMVGTLTSQLYTSSPFVLGRTSFAQLCTATNPKKLDCAVCDCTVPFSWLGEEAEKHLTSVFDSSVIVSL
ncbi:unnamed protein product [Auanema sp. JU1783]|nr:unnamed protein product [Auanema sp. JU1783]